MNERVAALEKGEANIYHQLDEIKNDVKDIRRLTVAVEKIAVRVEDTALKVDGISGRLAEVERAPAEDARYLRRAAIGCVITGLLGALLGALLQFTAG